MTGQAGTRGAYTLDPLLVALALVAKRGGDVDTALRALRLPASLGTVVSPDI